MRLGFVALLLGVGVARAQTSAQELTEVREAAFVPPIKGAPYSAELFHVLDYPARNGMPEKEIFQRRKIFRDSEGRVRIESLTPVGLPGGPHLLVTLTDQSAGRECFLNIDEKLAHCFSSIPLIPPSAAVAPSSSRTVEELGTRTVSGVRVEGTRSTHKAPDVITERWFSPELQVNIETRMENIGTLVNTESTENLRREEQDKRLFEVPAGFKVIEETGDRAVIFGGTTITNTMLRDRKQPVYTEQARRNRIEGTVTLSLIVGTDGAPSEIRVEHSLDAGLDQNAVAAVQQWRWDPARMNGKAVRTLNSVRVSFKLLANSN